MLLQLTIQNYTIISELSISFGEGFSVITGETGAGKSILAGALSFVLGQRADTSVLFDKTRKSVVEALFSIQELDLEGFFTENDIDNGDECLLRREITPQGKSRTFINDTPVSLAILRQLAEKMIDIHSQHANLLLQNKHFQLQMIDQFAHLQPELEAYRKCYRERLSLQRQYSRLQSENNLQETDYLMFIDNELEQAHLREGEQLELEKELEELTHAEETKQRLYEACQQTDEGEENIIGSLQNVLYRLQQAERYRKSLMETTERMESALIELKDLATEIRREMENTAYDPERTEEVRDRLNLLNSLQQKHRVADEAGLLRKHAEIREKLQRAENASEAEFEIQKALENNLKQLTEKAEKLHIMRQNALPEMQGTLLRRLAQMNMPHARAEITLNPTAFDENGQEEAEILFSANAGVGLQPIAKIASGGEMSRVMLAVKALISQKNILPTILFDEIDSGVSGEVTVKMAGVMRNIAKYSQVIAITHQPQIAAQADAHYLVFKETAGNRTRSDIRKLTQEERREAVARMLGDGELTATSLRLADELMERRNTAENPD